MSLPLLRRPPPPLPARPTAIYDFRPGANPGVLTDVSGNGYNLPLSGASTWVSTGLRFEGGRATANSIPARTERTMIAVYTMPDVMPNDWQIIFRDAGASYMGLRPAGTPINTFDASGSQRILEASVRPIRARETVFHALSVGEGSQFSVVSHQPELKANWTSLTRLTPVYIGADFGVFTGTLHYLLMYDRALTRSEVAAAQIRLRRILATRGVRF
ncbi:hypothetical protein WDJ50_02490 [Deinococcus sp. VB142]|uniref:LamG domain-containing protein n=1 Tax=Deinococcus sp. VB142 TaxID=3112952 RepID=A0AAU6Q3P2_9DEIO